MFLQTARANCRINGALVPQVLDVVCIMQNISLMPKMERGIEPEMQVLLLSIEMKFAHTMQVAKGR